MGFVAKIFSKPLSKEGRKWIIAAKYYWHYYIIEAIDWTAVKILHSFGLWSHMRAKTHWINLFVWLVAAWGVSCPAENWCVFHIWYRCTYLVQILYLSVNYASCASFGFFYAEKTSPKQTGRDGVRSRNKRMMHVC